MEIKPLISLEKKMMALLGCSMESGKQNVEFGTPLADKA